MAASDHARRVAPRKNGTFFGRDVQKWPTWGTRFVDVSVDVPHLPSVVDDAALAFPPPDFEPSFDYLGAFADAAPASSLASSSARSPLAIDRSRGRSGW